MDFSYEVSHSLQACEGAILVVDAAQGIEAQTLANVHLALRQDLVIIPVINKIDLPSAQPDVVIEELENVLAIPREEVILASAKEGTGVAEILEAIVQRVPPPRGSRTAPLRALVFDSHYDQYKGVVTYVRLAEGTLHEHERIRLMGSGAEAEILELGFFRPQLVPVTVLTAGEVGYIATGLKSVRDAQVGDTVTNAAAPAGAPLPGYQAAKSLVFAGIYPISGEDYPLLRDAMEKLHLNDASFTFEPESSIALGFGFRCGFLGLLHMEIVQERLEREFDLDLIASAPSVEYRVTSLHGPVRDRGGQPGPDAAGRRDRDDRGALGDALGHHAQRLHRLPDGALHLAPRLVPDDGVPRPAARPALVRDAAGRADRRLLRPAQEPQPGLRVDGLRGGRVPRRPRLVKLDVLVNGEPVDALSMIVHRDKAQAVGRALAAKLKQLIPRQMFEVPIQAAIGSNVVARETVRAMRKNVLAKCYGGDITRKKKLLEKQKEGKQRMKRVGSVEIPQDAFLAVLKMGEDA